METAPEELEQESGTLDRGRALQVDVETLFQRHPSPMWVYDRASLAFLQVNDAAVATYGFSAEEFQRMTLADIRDPAEIERLRAAVAEDDQAYRRWGAWRHRTRDGRLLDVLIATYGVEFAGRPATLTVVTDITEQRQAARRLEESEERLRHAQRLAKMGDWLWYPAPDPAQMAEGIALYSEEAALLFGVRPSDLAIGNRAYLERFVHPDDRAKLASCLYNLVKPQHENYSLRYRILRADGQARMIHEIAENVYDADGQLQFTRGTIQDVTELELLEQQLRQAQRMEALGMLTGGVAHDFNNLLTVIIGNVEMLRDSLPAAGSEFTERSTEALGAAQRAADLTQRLLTLSRQTVLRTEAIDLAALLGGLEPLLRRTLGQHLEVVMQLDPGLAPVLADASQLENAVINLAVNARDAMTAGGRLRLAAANVEIGAAEAAALHEVRPGSYVLLAVTDTGAGMPREVVERAFEPFFSTKGPGKGSGLGLSTVYGFVRQSGGYVTIDSAIGRGTSVRLYLPQAPAGDRPALPPAMPPVGPARGETVLVVEDDELIRGLAVMQLGGLGYRTLVAENGRAAEAILRSDAEIDLLMSDVVMPGGMSGLELFALAGTLRPGLKCLLVSGYAQDAFAKAGPGGRAPHFLAKPYRRQQLGRAVRAALDGAAPT